MKDDLGIAFCTIPFLVRRTWFLHFACSSIPASILPVLFEPCVASICSLVALEQTLRAHFSLHDAHKATASFSPPHSAGSLSLSLLFRTAYPTTLRAKPSFTYGIHDLADVCPQSMYRSSACSHRVPGYSVRILFIYASVCLISSQNEVISSSLVTYACIDRMMLTVRPS